MTTHSSGNAASLPTPPPHLTVRLAVPSLEYLRATGVQNLDEAVTNPSGGRPSEAAPLLHSQSVHMPWQSRIGERAVELIAHAGNRAARHAPAAPASASLSGYHSTAPLSALTPVAGLTDGRAIAQPADDGSDQQVDRLLRELAYGISFALSIGAVWWANRAAGLLTSLSFAGAAWQAIDALPVLEPDGGQDLVFGNGARTGAAGRAV